MEPAAVLLLTTLAAASPEPAWRPLAPGVSYAAIPFADASKDGDGKLHVVRIEPEKAEFRFVLSSRDKVPYRTAAQVAEQSGFVAVINAGMFGETGAAAGYLRDGDHVNNPAWNAYKSLFAFGPTERGLPRATLLDLDQPASKETSGKYRSVIQNLRLIGEGRDVWTRAKQRRWSEAAVAQDGEGRILFLFCRTPLTMTDFNRSLLALPLGIVRAMHVEGGSLASLSIRSKGLSLDLCGSFEAGVAGEEPNAKQRPIPNLLAVVGAPAGHDGGH